MNNSIQQLIKLYAIMVASRESDLLEAELVKRGEANFLATSRGHEGVVILAPSLISSDYLHCHYRGKALMLARGISNEMFFYSALCKAKSHSQGRQMVSHMSAPELNVLSIVGPVGNNALQAVGVAHAIKQQADNPIVLCSFGDGTSQQGEVLEAIAEAKRSSLPVLFFVHNNNLAISTRTQGKTFFSMPDGSYVDSFYQIPITYLDGLNAFAEFEKTQCLIKQMRSNRQPQIVVMTCDRLDNHSNADNQQLYRSDDEIARSVEQNDPIVHARQYLLDHGVDIQQLDDLEQQTIADVREALEVARQGEEPEACFIAEKPLPKNLQADANEYRGDDNAGERYTMLEAMRQVLYARLADSKDVFLYGQDIEDGKGDVFGMTKGLSTQFPQQVKNSPLSESTIVGSAAGMALAGKRPVAFLQFADFVSLAYNQILTEIGSMYWRTNGLWQTPVIILAACGAYRPGLGPFHSQTNEATLVHVPGIDVFMPSNAADAAGMLNAAFDSGRPSVILYPKKLLNNKSIADTTSKDVRKQLIPIGKARFLRYGEDITLVGWGNTVSLCEAVASTLQKVNVYAEVIDLRTLKPLDKAALISSAEKTGRVIVAHEDNHSCGLGAEVIASIIESSKKMIQLRRVTRADTFIPCNFPNQLAVLPSYEKILTAAAELLALDLTWQEHPKQDTNLCQLDVIGTSPSDETVTILESHVQIGDKIKVGDIVVDIEASKSAGEILAPYAGTIEALNYQVGDEVVVGEPLLTLRLDEGSQHNHARTLKPARAILQRKPEITPQPEVSVKQPQCHRVGIATPCFKTGSRLVENAELLANFPDLKNEDIVQRTGIKTRYHLAKGESIIDLAIHTSQQLLQQHQLSLTDIDMIICATSSPEQLNTPSTACLILERLNRNMDTVAIPAYDISAACSGYLYALQQAYDYLKSRPNNKVLVISADNLSSRLDKMDFDSAFLFADAATATLVVGENHLQHASAEIKHLTLSAIGECGDILRVPLQKTADGGIKMLGKKLFPVAVKQMAKILQQCCEEANVNLEAIDFVVPHQANKRIAAAIEKRLHLPANSMYSNIERYGNTSSSTIPIGLAESLAQRQAGDLIAMCAFGGGFTFAAGILQYLGETA